MAQIITAKYMEEKLKRGWTIDDFCRSLEMSKEEFLTIVKETFSPKGSSEYQRRLKKNQKKVRPNDTSLNNNIVSAVVETAVEVEIQELEEEKTTEMLIKEYQDELETIIEKSISVENSRKELLTSNSDFRRQLLEKSKELKEIKHQCQMTIKDIENLEKQILSNMSKASEMAKDLSSMHKRRDILSTKIIDLKKVTILLESDGSIEPSLDIPDTWEEYYTKLFNGELGSNDIIDNLTRSQIKQIAKIIAYAADTDLPYEIVTDNESIDTLLKSIL